MNQEKKWIKAIQKRSDDDAANQLIRKYYHEIFAFVFKQMFDQELTKDLTQEIFISMLRSIYQYDGRASFRTWLYRIANSRIIDFYRSKFYKESKQTHVTAEKLEWVEVPDDFVIDLENKEEADRVLEVLAQFDYQLQQIVRQKIYAEQTFKEIAISLDISESTVKTQYYTTIKKIKRELGSEKDE